MFYPIGTLIKYKKKGDNSGYVRGRVSQGPTLNRPDFDPENTNGITISTEGVDDMIITEAQYLIAIVAFPNEYLKANKKWHYFRDKYSNICYFFSDSFLKSNMWIAVRMTQIETKSATWSFEEAEKYCDQYNFEAMNLWKQIENG